MRRVFVPDGCANGSRVELTGVEAHYLRRVLRLSVGDCFAAVLPDGAERVATITRVGGNALEASLGQHVVRCADPQVDLRLFPGLPKADKLELIIQKCTELGVSFICPVICRRSVQRPRSERLPRKLARWRRIAGEAARQCGRTAPPQVQAPLPFSSAVTQASEMDGVHLILSPQPNAAAAVDLQLTTRNSKPISVLVGPEGGFAPEEVEEAVSVGFQIVNLGRRILRAETAAIAICTILMYRLGELS